METPDPLPSNLSVTNNQGLDPVRKPEDEVEQCKIEERGSQAKALSYVEEMELGANEPRSEIPAPPAYGSIMSPCRQVPLEVLAEAFAYLMEESRTDGFAQTLARLCQVCRHWRDAAFLVPKLWSEVSVSVAAKGFSYEALNTWLSRSRHIPRSLYLYSYPGCGATRCRRGMLCQFSNPHIARLLTEGPTLDSFAVASQTPECFENFAKSVQECRGEGLYNHWGSLRSLKILAAAWDYWHDIPASSFSFIPPSLTSLTIQLPPRDMVCTHLLHFNMPPATLARLTSLDLSCDWTIDYPLKLLQHCSNLESLTIDFNNAAGNVTDVPFTVATIQSGGIDLPTLRSCALRGLRTEMIATLSVVLRLPSMVELSLVFGLADDEWCPFADHVTNFFDRDTVNFMARFLRGIPNPVSALQKLTIANAFFRGDALFEALRRLPSVTHLTLDGVWFDAGFFDKCSSSPISLPKLEVLNLIRRHHAHFLLNEPVVLDDPAAFVEERGLTLTTSRCELCGTHLCFACIIVVTYAYLWSR